MPNWHKNPFRHRNKGVLEKKSSRTRSRKRCAPMGAQEGCTAMESGPFVVSQQTSVIAPGGGSVVCRGPCLGNRSSGDSSFGLVMVQLCCLEGVAFAMGAGCLGGCFANRFDDGGGATLLDSSW